MVLSGRAATATPRYQALIEVSFTSILQVIAFKRAREQRMQLQVDEKMTLCDLAMATSSATPWKCFGPASQSSPLSVSGHLGSRLAS